MTMPARPITLLSDYGYDDEFAGVLRAVIGRIAPGAEVVDLTHGIRRHAVAEGAVVLARSLAYAPEGIHVAVVDPGVGSERRGVAVRVREDERVLVGPDNGLLAPAIERFGGAAEAVDVSLSPFRLEPVAATFHGRDLFAPVAARLALGAGLGEAGDPVEVGSLAPSPLPAPRFEESEVIAHVVAVDAFGNASLDLGHEELPRTGLRLGRPVQVEVAGTSRELPYSLTFSDVPPGTPILYEDAYRALAIAVNRGSAAEELGLEPGTEVALRQA
jgi:S-adenosyl-L-methionine hydrolase (adenosine-forming)